MDFFFLIAFPLIDIRAKPYGYDRLFKRVALGEYIDKSFSFITTMVIFGFKMVATIAAPSLGTG